MEARPAPRQRTGVARPYLQPCHDLIDAEFETIGQSPHPPVQDLVSAALAGISASRCKSAHVESMEILVPGSKSDRFPRWTRGGPFFYLAGMLLAISAFWVSGGHVLLSGRNAPVDISITGNTVHAGALAISKGVRTERPAVKVYDGRMTDPALQGVIPGTRIDVPDRGDNKSR